MRNSILLLLGVLTFGCGGRSLTSDADSGDESGASAGDAGGASAGSNVPRHPVSVTPDTLASYGASGIGIALYAPDASAASVPLTVIEGDWHTDACMSLAFDSAGSVYALCYEAGPSEPPTQIVVFAAGSQGTDAPTRVITGPSTTLGGVATTIAVGATGKIYVVQDAYCQVTHCEGMVSVFAAGAVGDSAPVQVIQGSHTGLNYSAAIAVDAAGQIYVGNAEGGPILVFAADATGDAQPIRRIGRLQDIGDVAALAVDAAGTVYVADVLPARGVLVYGPTATQQDAPDRVIAGPLTELDGAWSVAVDRAGRVFASSQHGQEQPGTVSIFAAGASGNVAPVTLLPNVAGLGIALAP